MSQKLSVLFGGMSDYGMCIHARVVRPVKHLLHASTQMDNLSIDQLLACMQVIMKDEVMEESMAVTAVQTTRDKMRELQCGPI